ncbi:MAG: hypothetical protein HZA19_03400 [Nitrospirae bacterium]|nr:hypothetical protein [Nitrospirota bacterium]
MQSQYELMKFTIWFTAIGFWVGLVGATTLLGIDGLVFSVRKMIELEVVVGWAMLSGAGIGLVFDLLRHTWEPEMQAEPQDIRGKGIRTP